MAIFPIPEWVGELQAALGLEGRTLRSLDVRLRVREDEVVTASVSYEEFIGEKTIREITRCLAPVEFDQVVWQTTLKARADSDGGGVPMVLKPAQPETVKNMQEGKIVKGGQNKPPQTARPHEPLPGQGG